MASRTAPSTRVLRLCALLLAGGAPLAKASSAGAVSASAASKATAAGKAHGATRMWPFDGESSSLLAAEGTNTVEVPGDDPSYDEALPEPAPTQRPTRLQVRRPKHSSHAAHDFRVPGQGGLVIPDSPMAGPLPLDRTSELLAANPAKPLKVIDEYDDDLPAEGDSTPQAPAQRGPRRRPAPVRPAALASTQHKVSTGSKTTGQWDQCLKFATWVKAQSLQGPEVVQVWKNTCQPSVMSGSATTQYATMCEALGGAVEEFAGQEDWTPKQACTSVIRAFRESGVGATPLS